MHSGNEVTFAAPTYSGYIWLNYYTASEQTEGNIRSYFLGNGKGELAALADSNIYAGSLGWKKLRGGKLTSGSATIVDAAKYGTLLVSRHPGSEDYRTHICLPTGGIDGQMVTNMVYMAFNTTYSGDNCTISITSNPSNGNIDYVWGLVKYRV